MKHIFAACFGVLALIALEGCAPLRAIGLLPPTAIEAKSAAEALRIQLVRAAMTVAGGHQVAADQFRKGLLTLDEFRQATAELTKAEGFLDEAALAVALPLPDASGAKAKLALAQSILDVIALRLAPKKT